MKSAVEERAKSVILRDPRVDTRPYWYSFVERNSFKMAPVRLRTDQAVVADRLMCEYLDMLCVWGDLGRFEHDDYKFRSIAASNRGRVRVSMSAYDELSYDRMLFFVNGILNKRFDPEFIEYFSGKYPDEHGYVNPAVMFAKICVLSSRSIRSALARELKERGVGVWINAE